VLSTLEIENYQSIRKVSLRLGRFTVITGPTGSGKTAIFRAARHLVFNSRGDSYITRGQKTSKVAAGSEEEGWAAGIERGKTNCYRITKLAGAKSETATFTKLAGGVPEAVQGLLRLGKLNFASQFDSPFLLEESAGEVARVLGALTNVTVVFEAAREANRRKARLADQLKDRQAELSRLQAEAQSFAGLPGRLQAVQAAEAAQGRLEGIQARGARLQQLLAQRETAHETLWRAAAAVQPVPDLEKAEAAYSRWRRLGDLLTERESLRLRYMTADSAATASVEQTLGLEREHHRMLTEAGVCPVCGQTVG
jgi:DNA repair protein SbcC/Rad50